MKILQISKDKSLFSGSGPAYDELMKMATQPIEPGHPTQPDQLSAPKQPGESSKTNQTNQTDLSEQTAQTDRIEEIHVIIQTLKTDQFEIKKVGTKVFLYPTNSSSPFFYIKDTISIAKYQLTLKFRLIVDLISAEDSLTGGLAAYFISWKYGKNFIIGVHQHFEDMVAKDNFFTKAVKRDIQKLLMNKATGIRVSMQTIGEELYGHSPEFASKIYILPFVKELEEFREAITNINIHDTFKQFNIILLLSDRKIPFRTIKSAKNIVNELRHRYPRIGLVVIGKMKWPLISSARKFFLPSSIAFGKRIKDMTSYYRTANVFIDTTIARGTKRHANASVKNNHELSSTSPMLSSKTSNPEITNAALAGCPMVVARTLESELIVRDSENGFISDPRNVKLFARKIIDILEQNGLREQMRIARFEITEVYGKSLEGYIERLTGIWQACKTIQEKKVHIPKHIKPLTDKQASRSKAITMLVAERVKQKVAAAPAGQFSLAPREGDMSFILDLDKIKVSIEDVLKEIESEPDKIPSNAEEILDV